MWVRASGDQEGPGKDRPAPSAVRTMSRKIHFRRSSSGLCATVLECFFQSRGRSCCGLVSRMLMPGIHVCWASGMEDFQCTDKMSAVPTEGHTLGPQSTPQLWDKCEGLHLGAKGAGCQRHLYSRGHCGRASGQTAPSGGQGHPHSHEAWSRLFCSSSSVCNQLQSRDRKLWSCSFTVSCIALSSWVQSVCASATSASLLLTDSGKQSGAVGG